MAKKPETPTVDELKLPDATTQTLPDGSPAAGQATEAKAEDNQHPAEALGLVVQPAEGVQTDEGPSERYEPPQELAQTTSGKRLIVKDEVEATNILNAKVDAPFANERAPRRDMVEHLAQLVGGKITGLIASEEALETEKFYGLRVVVDIGVGRVTNYDVWIEQDPEGNGPGFLRIEEET